MRIIGRIVEHITGVTSARANLAQAKADYLQTCKEKGIDPYVFIDAHPEVWYENLFFLGSDHE